MSVRQPVARNEWLLPSRVMGNAIMVEFKSNSKTADPTGVDTCVRRRGGWVDRQKCETATRR